MKHRPSGEIKSYAGSPIDIVKKIADDIGTALAKAGIPCSPIHSLGMFYMAIATIVGAKNETPAERTASYNSCLMMLTRAFTGTTWTEEEHDAFNQDFVEMLQALGTDLTAPMSATIIANKDDMMPFLAPMSKEVH